MTDATTGPAEAGTPGDAASPDAGIPDDAAVLDRIEDGRAVLLVGPSEVEVVLDASRLPAAAREGDWFRVGLTPDPALTAARRSALDARLERIRRTRGGGRFDPPSR